MASVEQRIHDATMELLSTTGVRFHHPDAREILKSHGIALDGEVARFTEDQLMEWVGKAPETVKVAAMDPRFSVEFGDGKTYLGPAAGPVSVVEADGTRRASTFDDYVKTFKLFEVNDRFSVNGGAPVYPEGVDPAQEPILGEYAHFMMSNKTNFARAGSYAQVEAIVAVLAAAFGCSKEALADEVRSFNVCNVNSPLQLDDNMTETLLTYAKYRMPVAVTSAAMAGSTAPVTAEGTIAQVNAEVLAVIALAQMAAPGLGVLYGSQSASADMKTLSIAIGSPESALCYRWAARMADFYHIPCRAGGVLSDAKKLDAQSGFESLLTYLACKQSKVALMLQGAGVLNSYLDFSFEKAVCDFEIIDFVDKYLADIDPNEDTVPIETMESVGQDGSYVLEDHTLENYHEALLAPVLAVRGVGDANAFEQRAAKRVGELLGSYRAPERDPEQVSAMRAAAIEGGVDAAVLDMLDSKINSEKEE